MGYTPVILYIYTYIYTHTQYINHVKSTENWYYNMLQALRTSGSKKTPWDFTAPRDPSSAKYSVNATVSIMGHALATLKSGAGTCHQHPSTSINIHQHSSTFINGNPWLIRNERPNQNVIWHSMETMDNFHDMHLKKIKNVLMFQCSITRWWESIPSNAPPKMTGSDSEPLGFWGI